jgi:hypothetical protein
MYLIITDTRQGKSKTIKLSTRGIKGLTVRSFLRVKSTLELQVEFCQKKAQGTT